jgi:hypothetical protein
MFMITSSDVQAELYQPAQRRGEVFWLSISVEKYPANSVQNYPWGGSRKPAVFGEGISKGLDRQPGLGVKGIVE